jgi:hypothetical protein
VLTDIEGDRLNLGPLGAAENQIPRLGHSSGGIGPEDGKKVAQFYVPLVSALR